MKTYTMFNYEFLFGDFQQKLSPEAKLLYIKLNFYANNGFVSNPISICDSMGYEKGVLLELIAAEEILTLENRSEVFITSFFVHNKGIKPSAWLLTPYAPYWKGKLWTKKNGMATFKKQDPEKEKEETDEQQPTTTKQEEDNTSWEELVNQLQEPKRND